MSDFEWTILQRDKLWIIKFTTRQLFTWTLCTVSDFAENFASMKSRLFLFSAVKMAHLTVFVFFKRLQFEVFYFIASDTDLKELTTSRVFNWELYNLSSFERIISLRVRFWSYKITSRLTLNWKAHNKAGFELNIRTTCCILIWKVYNV